MATIKIVGSNPTTGHLDLDPPEFELEVDKNETIVWKPVAGCGVKLISNIRQKEKPPSNVIFSEMIHRVGTSDNWRCRISRFSPNHSKFYYSIFWEPEENPDPGVPFKEHDPVIAVRPSPTSFFRILLMVLTAILSIFTVTLVSKKKKRKHGPKKQQK